MGTQYVKPPIEPAQFARNGQYPDAFLQSQIAELANQISAFRLKEVARFGSNVLNIPVRPAFDGDRTRWRSYFVASPTAKYFYVKVWMAQTTLENPASDPYARVRIATTAGVTLGDAEFHYGATNASVDAPAYFAPMGNFVADATDPTILAVPTAGVLYTVTVSDFQSRIVACTVYEGTNEAAPFSEGYATGTPILDVDRGGIAAASRLMWKLQAAPLFNWNVDVQAAPRTRTSATAINLIDNTNTTVSGASLGFTLDLRYKARVNAATVPFLFAAYCSVAAGTGGTILLKDSAGSTMATLAAAGTSGAGWYTTTATLPATLAKYDITYAGDGTNVFSVMAVTAMQWQTGS